MSTTSDDEVLYLLAKGAPSGETSLPTEQYDAACDAPSMAKLPAPTDNAPMAAPKPSAVFRSDTDCASCCGNAKPGQEGVCVLEYDGCTCADAMNAAGSMLQIPSSEQWFFNLLDRDS